VQREAGQVSAVLAVLKAGCAANLQDRGRRYRYSRAVIVIREAAGAGFWLAAGANKGVDQLEDEVRPVPPTVKEDVSRTLPNTFTGSCWVERIPMSAAVF
jgi:hypothetical protein